MFNRKSLLIAFLAVALLVSSLALEPGVYKRSMHKPRAMVGGGIAVVDQTLQQAGFTNLMNQITGTAKTLDLSGNVQEARTDRRPRRPRHTTAAIGPAGFTLIAGIV